MQQPPYRITTRQDLQAANGKPIPFTGPGFCLSGSSVCDAPDDFARPAARTAAPATPAILRAPKPAPEPSIEDQLSAIGRQSFASRTGQTAKPAPTASEPTSFAEIAQAAYATRKP